MRNAVSYRNKGHNTARRQSVSRTQTYIFRLTFCRKITAVYPQNHIFIHKAKYPDLFLHGAEAVRYSPAELKKRAKNGKVACILLQKV